MRMLLIPGIVVAIIPLAAAFFVKGARRLLPASLGIHMLIGLQTSVSLRSRTPSK
jgi:hypothetical protein